ncbi:LysR family transcriptional regulator [Actinomadura opuntiae]|uniref:LysR family transcriptional regulator n=1 Tax=Actinomadura sp. OS1-43 TaxID=604315 RepID=UPI00255B164B|nr:LysR family transcriptional regulator [Actinomadura sp. OS1-43]MDL4820441.1 LysR family transcriptional regulator [Actinomadura sp. OS1-43]
MPDLETRELECFLVLSEDLHFGRTAERLYLSQSRVSQLLRALESRIGARLVERTSRRVRLTPLGASLRDELRPAYTALRDVVDAARARARDVAGVLRIGFLGSMDEDLTGLVRAFQDDHPGCEVQTVEVPLADPFGAVRDGTVDAAIVLAPVREPALASGPVFSEAPLSLAVPARHPLADRPSVPAEDLAGHPLIRVAGPAPRYWREAQSPRLTPGGRAIPSGPAVGTIQEALAMVASGRGAMPLCVPTARRHARGDVVFVPLTGLPDSALTLVWHRDRATARVHAFAGAVARLPRTRHPVTRTAAPVKRSAARSARARSASSSG